MHARSLTLTAAAGQRLTVTADPPVDFARPPLVTRAAHGGPGTRPTWSRTAEPTFTSTAAHHGIGSASCGPPPAAWPPPRGSHGRLRPSGFSA